MSEMNDSKAIPFSFAKLAIFGVAAYAIWKNRYKLQELLEAQGVKTPWSTEGIVDAVKSGSAKVRGATKYGVSHETV